MTSCALALIRPSDAELARGAQAGDEASLAILIQRYRPGMLAVALGVLGMGADAEDAVQDATLTAVRRIGELRDPGMAGAWLRAIVRNCCLMQLRSRRDVPLGIDPATASARLLRAASAGPPPEEVIERHALRDWVWRAIGDLSPALRQVIMLRYFSDVSAYDEIAVACDIPVGTVRSRLNQARARLTTVLRETADAAHADAGRVIAASRSEAIELLSAADRGEYAAAVADRWAPEMQFVTDEGYLGGRDSMISAINQEIAVGMRGELVNAVASHDLVIWEMDIINPPDRPGHCPPAVTWLLSLHGGRVRRLRLFHPRGKSDDFRTARGAGASG